MVVQSRIHILIHHTVYVACKFKIVLKSTILVLVDVYVLFIYFMTWNLEH